MAAPVHRCNRAPLNKGDGLASISFSISLIFMCPGLVMASKYTNITDVITEMLQNILSKRKTAHLEAKCQQVQTDTEQVIFYVCVGNSGRVCL